MNKELRDRFINDIVDVVTISHASKTDDGKINWIERFQIGREVLDLAKYIEDMDGILEDLKALNGEGKMTVLLEVNGLLFQKGLYSEDVEDLVDAIIRFVEAGVELGKVAILFKKRERKA